MPSTRPALAAVVREITGKKVAHLRREGRLPAVVYGHGVASRSLSIDAHEFELLRRRIGPNALIDLSVDGKKATPVLIHGIGVNPVTQRPLHVDLFQVRMSEELTVDVPVHFTGEAEAVTKHGGTLTHEVESLKVRALPDHLPQQFTVAIDSLTDFDARIHVRDVAIPDGVTVLSDPDGVIAHVLPPRVEEPEVTAEAEAEGAAAAGEATEAAGEGGES
ncbi:MAG TPA: 50S ribosomal protein L25 [Candidatus Limnocylindrales bacterium]